MKNKPTHFEYGGRQLKILNQKSDIVPTQAFAVELPDADKQALALAIEKDLPVLLIGETGTGKTSVARYLAFKCQQAYTRINMHGYNTPDELIGSKSVKNGSTYYEQGILTDAMIKGHLVVLDEINATPPDCMFILHGLLDEDKRISLPNGDIIKPHKDFRFFATMNPDYEGTRGLNRAFLDRFAVVLDIEILKPKKEINLLVNRLNLTQEIADNMVTVAWMARKSYEEQKTMLCVSTRTLLHWGNLMMNQIEPEIAFVKAIANKARKEERQALLEFYYAVFKVTAPTEDDSSPVLTTKGEIKQMEKDKEHYKVAFEEKIKEMEDLERKVTQIQTDMDKAKANDKAQAGSIKKSTYEALKQEKTKLEKEVQFLKEKYGLAKPTPAQ